MYPENTGDEGFGNDDEEYIPNYEFDDDEDVTSSKVPITKFTLKGPSSKRRCMSDFLPKQQQDAEPRKHQQKNKGRGPTVLPHVHNRPMDERPVIILNSYGQPVGPTKKLVSEYSLFLGTLARNPEYLLLNYCDWPSVPDNAKDQVWDYVQRKYLISSEGKHETLETVKEEWKGWKSRINAKYYSPFATYHERWDKRPNTILENQFKELMHYWENEATKKQEDPNK
ncbi:hypothetical protein RDABS01_029614 [Bienertia sinuspersici]